MRAMKCCSFVYFLECLLGPQSLVVLNPGGGLGALTDAVDHVLLGAIIVLDVVLEKSSILI